MDEVEAARRRFRWAALVVSVLLAGCGKSAPPGGEATAEPATTATVAATPPPPPPRPKGPAVESVAIVELLSEYRQNEVRADGRFKGKLLRISGKVGEVKKALIGDGIVLTVGTGAMLEIPILQCAVAEGQEQAAAALNKGEKVTVEGVVSGLLMNVQMQECVIDPVTRLCERMKTALGAKDCGTGRATGMTSIRFEGNRTSGVVGGVLVCAAASEAETAAANYDMLQGVMKEPPMSEVAGSRRALCLGSFAKTGPNEKPEPFPQDRLATIKAFFDSL